MTDQGLVRERIKSHSSLLSNGLYLLWTGELYCDCILIVNDKEMKCHSCVIASFSPLLQIKLVRNLDRTRSEDNRHLVIIDLSDVIVFTDLEPLVRYMYTGELCFKKSQVPDILKGAQILGLKEIEQFCLVWMTPTTLLSSTDSLKTDISDREHEQKNCDGSGTTNEDNTTSSNGGEKEESILQDYINILDSWQRSVTGIVDNTKEPKVQSIHMLRSGDCASVSSLLHTPKKETDAKNPSLKTSSPDTHSPVLRKCEGRGGSQKRKYTKRPLFSRIQESDDGKPTSTLFDKKKLMDQIYVNFDNQKEPVKHEVTSKGKKHDRVVVLLPTATTMKFDNKVKNVRKRSQPRKLIKRQRTKYMNLTRHARKAKKEHNLDDNQIDADGNSLKGDSGKGESQPTLDKEVLVVISEKYTCFKVLDHNSRAAFRCPHCNRIFRKLLNIKQHMESHANDKLTVCTICGHAYMRPCDLTRHVRSHSFLKCNRCEFVTKTPRMYVKHNLVEHGIDKPFVCTHEGCKFATTRRRQLDNHMPVHAEVEAYQHLCIHCCKTFAHRAGLLSHLKSCLQKRDLLCDVCGKAFNHLGSLKSHRRVHFGEKPFHCTECPSRFSDHRNLKRHKRVHQKVRPNDSQLAERKLQNTTLKRHMQAQYKPPIHDLPQSDEMDAWRVNMDVILEAAERMVCSASTILPTSTTETRAAGTLTRETLDANFHSMQQPYSAEVKRSFDREQNNIDLNSKIQKASTMDLSLNQPYVKHTETGHLEHNQGHYSQLGSYLDTERKVARLPTDSRLATDTRLTPDTRLTTETRLVSDTRLATDTRPATDTRRLAPASVSDSMRPVDYQTNINLRHSHHSMAASGYPPGFSPFSPLVPPDLHSFYSSQGLLPPGHLDVHAHHGITQAGGRLPSSYPQLHDYSVSNLWRSAHDDLNSP